ncbi:MAG: cell division protein ZapD [Gammaproteobacteria bacterium]|nr:cell division protein ZapD [Gammaproteobacteria bacterium]
MEANAAKSFENQPMHARVIQFEHPLNERYRFFLRLEYLFNLMEHHLSWESPENSHTALSALLDIINVINRTDIKAETVKELDRIWGVLTPLKGKPGIETGTLDGILSNLKQLSAQLRNITGPIDKDIKDDELLKTLQFRNNIAGGLCDFDIPAYRYWLRQPAGRRLRDLQTWQIPFHPLKTTITCALELVRQSTTAERQVAEDGVYKQSLDPKVPCQLIIVSLPGNTTYFAEFSGSKHRFTVRFLDATQKHPIQTNQRVEFDLSCCKL